MDNTRLADLQELTHRLKYAVGSERQSIERSIESICNESGAVRSMRESLIKAARRGDAAEVRDINEYVASHSKYRSE